MQSPPSSAYQRLGGAAGLRAIMADFVASLYACPMVGFYFARVPQRRLLALETAYAAAHLGGPSAYRGRPLAEAHRRHAIGRGHFLRRRFLLAQSLAKHDVLLADARDWLRHQDAQAYLVVQRGATAACPTRT